MSSLETVPLVSVHVLRDTSLEKREDVVDGGRFIEDVAAHGLELVMTSRRTFDSGEVFTPKRSEEGVDFHLGELSSERPIEALYSRTLSQVKAKGSEGSIKLNANEVKLLAGSKIDLYQRVLSEYQVPTKLLSMQSDEFATMAEVIENVSTSRVVLKSNRGAGGYSTKIMTKPEALAWVAEGIEADDLSPHIVQPEIMFGRLPSGFKAIGTEWEKDLVERAKVEKLLTELRMFVIKRGAECDFVPLLRVVPTEGMPMQGRNDTYIDVDVPSGLMDTLTVSSKVIVDTMGREAGDIDYLVGAIDYYFDEQGAPGVMEANFRSPQLPVTRENPRAGRQAHKALARALAGMVQSKKGEER